MEFIRNFKQLSRNDVFLAGGKGASLGEVSRLDMPVPPGFVILSSAFEKFLKETDINVEINTRWRRIKKSGLKFVPED